MKTLIATLLATAAGASFAAAPTAALNHDPATYRNVTQKSTADYQAAVAKCDVKGGNDKDVCMAEARLARTRGETSALSQYNNTAAGRERARAGVADAEFAVAKAKCDGKSGTDKDSCMDSAKAVHNAALADAKNGNANGAAVSAVAVDKCAEVGDAKTGCLIQTKPAPVRDTAAATATTATTAADNAANSARAAADTAAVKTRDAAATAADKTRAVAATAAEKTKEVAGTVAEKTDVVAAGAADKTRDATAKTRIVAADTAITTKVKAGLLKEPKLESLGIHVETEKGTVMLSGFVNSKAEADKAVLVAKGVDGVATVKSAIQVK
jgi:osmotically-inducible protein OsmY